jgi:hypothetical protein
VGDLQVFKLVAHVYDRAPGNPPQEAAGVATTLLAWAAATGEDLEGLVAVEVNRIQLIPVETMRARQAAKAAAGVALAPS